MEKEGFIYIWYDRKRKMFYIGSHWGTEDDDYICSSRRMRDVYRRRPEDFKRRIIKRKIARSDLLTEEHRWLLMISENELGKKYYNLRQHRWGHWSTDINKNLTIREKIIEKLSMPEVKEKLSRVRKGKTHSKEAKQKIKEKRAKQIYTKETCRKISESHMGKKNHFYGKNHSEETKKHMSEVAKGRIMPEEVRKKMSESAKKRWQNVKQMKDIGGYSNA